MIARDKLVHFAVNLGVYLLITAAFGAFFRLMGSIVQTLSMTRVLRYLVLNALGFVACLAMSFTKEYGNLHSTGFDYKDILADLLGAFAGFMFISIVFLVFGLIR